MVNNNPIYNPAGAPTSGAYRMSRTGLMAWQESRIATPQIKISPLSFAGVCLAFVDIVGALLLLAASLSDRGSGNRWSEYEEDKAANWS